MQHSDTR